MKAECWCYYVRLTADDQHVQKRRSNSVDPEDTSPAAARFRSIRWERQDNGLLFPGLACKLAAAAQLSSAVQMAFIVGYVRCILDTDTPTHRHTDTCMWPRPRHAIKPTLSLDTTQHCLPLFYFYHLQDHRRKAQAFKNTTDESKSCLCSNPPSLHR